MGVGGVGVGVGVGGRGGWGVCGWGGCGCGCGFVWRWGGTPSKAIVKLLAAARCNPSSHFIRVFSFFLALPATLTCRREIALNGWSLVLCQRPAPAQPPPASPPAPAPLPSISVSQPGAVLLLSVQNNHPRCQHHCSPEVIWRLEQASCSACLSRRQAHEGVHTGASGGSSAGTTSDSPCPPPCPLPLLLGSARRRPVC